MPGACAGVNEGKGVQVRGGTTLCRVAAGANRHEEVAGRSATGLSARYTGKLRGVHARALPFVTAAAPQPT